MNITRVNSAGSLETDAERNREGQREREGEGEGEGEGYMEGYIDLEGSTSIYSIRSDEEEGSGERGDTVRVCSVLIYIVQPN